MTAHRFAPASLLLSALLLSLLAAPLGCSGCDGERPSPGAEMGSGDMARDSASEDDLGDGDLAADLSQDGDLGGLDAEADFDVVITPQGPEQEALLATQKTETWKMEGLSAPAHVIYTEMGRPHVYAANEEDLGQVLGFTVARDRFFLMDLQRRLGQGRLSELLGDAALPNDVEARHTGMKLVTERLLAYLDEEDAAYLDAYVRGINAYIEQVRRGRAKPPSEYETFKLLLGARNEAELMAPFTRRDVAAMVAVIMYQTNFETGDVSRTARAARLEVGLYPNDATPMVEARRAGAVEDIWRRGIAPLFEVSSVPGWTIERGPGAPLGALPAPKLKRALKLEASTLERASKRLEALSERLGKRELDNFGSNTWAVAATHTEDGSSLVAGDGHLPLDLPALMYQIGLDTRAFAPDEQARQAGLRQSGLLITSLPILAVGTNGQVAWSQVNPFADITDWYSEELTLDDDGSPASSMFQGEARALRVVEERYEINDVPALQSVGRTEVLKRFETFDGRLIVEIEGDAFSPEERPTDRVTFFNGASFIAPRDVNEDGAISAISLDYTAFDTTQYISTTSDLARSESVSEYQEITKGFIGNLLYSAVADQAGDVLFTSYQAVPCRGYLPRDASGEWLPGAHPAMLLDGTRYGGFTIPSLEDGKVDESQGAADPYKCVVPFDETPQAISPEQGYVLNANNQPAPITNDGALHDDPWYIGGPWRAVRADSIDQRLRALTQAKSASIKTMAKLQGERRSRTGELFMAPLLDAIARAKNASLNVAGEPHEERLGALYASRSEDLEEVALRLAVWREGGFATHSGVDTFYNTSSAESRQDAVATMIFNAWLPRAMQATFHDEPLEYYTSSSIVQMRTLKRMLDGRDDNATSLASFDALTGESAFFDRLDTPQLERSEEILVASLIEALDFLASEPEEPGVGGFGSEMMDSWLWGLRHQVRFASILGSFFAGSGLEGFLDAFSITTKVLPLAEGPLPEGDPRAGLKWFPRPGDNFAVDAANPGFDGTRFTHGSGPVMRMVIALKDGTVSGQNIIPGGQSARTKSPFYADQVALWLANETLPLRYTPEEVAAGAVSRALFLP